MMGVDYTAAMSILSVAAWRLEEQKSQQQALQPLHSGKGEFKGLDSCIPRPAPPPILSRAKFITPRSSNDDDSNTGGGSGDGGGKSSGLWDSKGTGQSSRDARRKSDRQWDNDEDNG